MRLVVTVAYCVHRYIPLITNRVMWLGLDHGTLSEYLAGRHLLTEDTVPERCQRTVSAGLDVAEKHGIPVCTWATYATVRVGGWFLLYTGATLWAWLFTWLVGVSPVMGEDDLHHDGSTTLGSQLYAARRTGAHIVHPHTDHVISLGILPYLFNRSRYLYQDVMAFLRGHCRACDGTLAHDEIKEYTCID